MKGLCEVLSAVRAAAHAAGRPTPVIYTDIESAHELGAIIMSELGAPVRFNVRDPAADHIVMFDGVKIRAIAPPVAVDPHAGWREHFGLLADIFDDETLPPPGAVTWVRR